MPMDPHDVGILCLLLALALAVLLVVHGRSDFSEGEW